MVKNFKIIREVEPKVKKIKEIKKDEEGSDKDFSGQGFSDFEEEEPIPTFKGGALEKVHETGGRSTSVSADSAREDSRGDRGTEREFNYTTITKNETSKTSYVSSGGDTNTDVLRERSLNRGGLIRSPDFQGRAFQPQPLARNEGIFEGEQGVERKYEGIGDRKSKKRSVGPWE